MDTTERRQQYITVQDSTNDMVNKVKTIFSSTEMSESHYYGKYVRFCLLGASILMAFTLPFTFTRYSMSLFTAIFLIVISVLLAGATNHRQKWTAISDWTASVLGFCFFEYYAVTTFAYHSFHGFFFYCQLMAIIFIASFYFATKTVRGFTMR